MDRMIYTAMSGASQTMSRQAAVAHNLANVNATGYRAEEHRLRSVSVFNFFRPDYAPPGEIADAGRVAPEMQIANEPPSAGPRCSGCSRR